MDPSELTIKDIMSFEVVSVTPETPLVEAASLIAKHNFDGLPVIDGAGKLAGILTECDLVSKGSMIHLPTLQIVLKNLSAFKKDRSQFEKEVAEVANLKVRDVMNVAPLTLPSTASLEEVETAFREHHRVNPIPILDEEKNVVGVVSRFDILKPLHMLHAPLETSGENNRSKES